MHKGLGVFYGFFCFFFLCSNGKPSDPLQLPTRTNFRMLSSSSPPYLDLENNQMNIYLNVLLYGSQFANWNSAANGGDVPMLIALYTSQTLLSNGCLNFINSDYIEDTLTQDLTNTSVLNFPYFQVEDYYTVNSLSATYAGIDFPSTGIIASSCTASSTTPYGTGTYGLIGMGTQGRLLGSFSPIFSLYFAQDSSSGQLFVGSDSSYMQAKTFANVLTTDENWQLHGVKSIQIASYAGAVNLSLIFDMNANAIGFPLDIFQNIVSSLASAMSINCSNETNQPSCDYVGEIHDFPDLLIVLENQTIVIPSEVYVFEGYEEMTFLGSVTLNLRGLSPNLSNQSYVTPAYSNYVILDYHVLSYYYTIFDAAAGNVISLYTIDRIDYITIYILSANAGLLLAMGIFYFVTHIKKKSEKPDEGKDQSNNTNSKSKKEEKKKLKKGRRAGVMTSRNATMVYNRNDYQNVSDKDKSQEEKDQINIISAAELTQKINEAKESSKVKEFELTTIPTETRIARDPES